MVDLLLGEEIYGSGSIENLSKLKLSYDGEEVFAESIRFIINEMEYHLMMLKLSLILTKILLFILLLI